MKARFTFFLLAAISGFVASCGDDKKEDPAPETGTVSGTISPANSASKVYLITGTDTIKGTPTVSGSYELTEVKAGTYSLAFKATENFDAPAPTSVVVNARQTTNVPAVTFTALPPNGIISVDINGVTHTGSPGYFFGGDYPMYINGNGFPNNANGHDIRFTLPVITGPGTYTTADRGIEITVGNFSSAWWANYSMGSASITVTSFNPATKRINATFTFRAWNSDDPDKVGTNGIMKNVRVVQ